MSNKINDVLNNIAKLLQPVFDLIKTKDYNNQSQRDYVAERKYISSIIYDVILSKTIIREALLKFPKDLEDESAITAYHALIHIEADEDMRKKDPLYAQEQEDYILYIAETLQKGEELPKNIINSYKKFYAWTPSLFSLTKKGIWAKLKRFINV